MVIGQRLGPYEVLAKIGEGGMGEVYRATDINLNRSVAIKVLPEAVASDPERLARFDREAKTLAAINHPHIAQIYGLEKSDGTSALVMELVDGPTLADRIAQGAIPIDEALPIAKQIAEALEAAHEQGIIHRDLKPANIKVRLDGTVKVLDFGLAKALEPAGAAAASGSVSLSPTITTPAMTQMGMILGTAAYMSPEQAKGRAVDRRVDIWAFGCVLYEMLTGRRAFEGEDLGDTLAGVIRGEPDWQALPPDTPPAIRTFLKRCLDKDRRQRITDISTARFVIDDVSSGAPAVTTVSPATRSGRRERLAYMVAALGVVAALALGVLALSRPRAEAPAAVRFEFSPPAGTTLPSVPPLALSPDGRNIAFVVSLPGNRLALAVRALDGVESRVLAGTDTPSSAQRLLFPFWSPDSRFIGFFAEGKLKTIEVAGGSPPRGVVRCRVRTRRNLEC